ncbi:MAG: PAS domain S-box protein, partial [Elainellaceae cyanobacterium]
MVCQTIRVLAVDDNEIDIQVINRYLKSPSKTEFKIQSTDTLKGAIAAVNQSVFDIILLDLILPDSEGIDTLRSFLECPIHAPVVVMTGNDDDQTSLELIRVGAQAYLAKWELTPKLLVRTIHHTLEKASMTELLKQREQQLGKEIERRIEIEKGLERGIRERTQALEREVVQRQHTESLLQRQLTDLEIVFKALPSAIMFADRDRCIRKVSSALTTLFGYTPEDVLGKPTCLLYHSDYDAQVQGKLWFERLAYDTFEPYDFQYQRKDGSVFVGETVSTPVKDRSGQTIGFVAIIRDVTQQRQLQQEYNAAQLEVTHREVQLQQFVKHMPAAVAMFDTQMRYLFHSDRWVTDYGLQDSNLLGKCHYDLFPGTPERWRANYQTCLGGKVLRNDEDSFVREDGSTDWFKWEIRPWYDPSGCIGGLLMVTEVITPQKQAQLKLQESESRFKAFMDHSFAVTFMKDAAGRYTYVNQQFE